MKHLGHWLAPGARLIDTFSWSGYENQLAFVNPDGTVVVMMQNDLCEPLEVHLVIGGTTVTPTLPADSFATLVIRP